MNHAVRNVRGTCYLVHAIVLTVICSGCAARHGVVRHTLSSNRAPRSQVELVKDELGIASLAAHQAASDVLQTAALVQPLPAAEPHHHLPRPQQQPTDIPNKVGNEYVPPPAIPSAPSPLSTFAVSPGAGMPLTLDESIGLACRNNPTLLQARAQVQGTLGEAIQAGLWPNPTFMYVAEQIGVGGTPGEFHGGIVRQRIVAAHKLDLSREKYLSRTRVAEWLGLAQQYRVLNDVRVHYFRARGHQGLVQIERELLKNAEDLVVTRREMYNLGQTTRAEVHTANVQLQRQRLKVLAAENDLARAFEELTAIIGLDLAPGHLATPLEGDLAPIDWNEALARQLTESPQIMAARNKLEADRLTVRREIVQPVPDLIVEGGSGYNFEAGQAVGTASVAVEVPLFDWNQGTIRQAEADYARQQGEVRRTELVLRQELAREYRSYLTALQHVRNYQEIILPESRAAYEILLRSYKDDRAPWMDVLAAEREYFSLRSDYVTNLIAWRESEALIMGFLLHGGLQAPTNPTPPGHIDSVPKPR